MKVSVLIRHVSVVITDLGFYRERKEGVEERGREGLRKVCIII